MASYKCKMCGAPLDVENGQTVATCNFCGSKQTVANADDERKENLFNRANALRINCEFDKAQLAYQSILSIFPTEPEAHWGVTLCKYGIEYVDDPATKKKKPTIHRMSFESILKDSDYLAALANADAIAKEQYQAEAKEIADIQKNILTISQKEEPFDIFICYKETNDQHKRTPDSVMAQEIYTTLTDKGYKVFFSRITLENKLGTMYEPYIFAALNSAKIMLVIGTKKEYFEAVWVKNEWSRFLSLMQTRPDHYLIPCYKDMNAYEMPEEFLSFQAQDLGKLGFMQDLIRGIDKIMGKDTQAVQQETRIIQTDVNVDALLTRAEILIGDKNYEKADELLERVLNNDPKNSQAYLLKLVIELQLTSIDELKNEENTLEGKSNFQKAYDFGSAEQKARLNSINEYIENRNEEARLSRLYDIAMDYKNEGKYTEAEQAFSEIAGFRDATAQAAECVKLDKEGIYKRAVTFKESKNYDDAIATFEKIIDFSDSEKQIAECKELKKSDIYKQALALKEEGKFDEASALFMTILNYNDSDFQVDECERLKTEAQKEAVYASCVIREEINPYFHANQLKQACKKLATIPGYKDADQLLVKYEGILKDYERELQIKKEEKARARAKKMKKFKWISIFSSIGALIITGVLLLTFLYLVPENRQNKIQSLIDSGKYDEAIALVEENGGYGDSKNLIQMAKAGQAFEALDYETGIDYIYNIGGAVDVNYDAKGGTPEKTGETIKRRKYIDNDSEKDGYTFHGWKLSEYSIKSASHYAAITLDAQYETITYTLEFDLKGGTCPSLPTTYNTEESVAIPNPTRKGYTFTGWTGIGLSEPQIDYVLPVGSIGNKKFTATWSANHYQIHLDTNGGTVSKDVVDVVFDSYYTLPTPSFDGYTFKGWFDSSSVQYSSGTYTLDRDLYLTARWEAIVYTITYNLNGGTNNPGNPTTYKVNDSNHVLQDPSRVGYTFLGWTTSSISTPTKDITISTGTFGNLTFTANWSANKYNVTVLLNGGEASKTSYEVTYDSLYSIEEPTRVGYGFTGFIDTNNNTFASSGIWKVDGDVTLTATWSANTNTPYKVKHYLENIAGTDYVLDDTETKYGTSDSMITVYSKNYTGFTPEVVSKETKLLPDGSLVVELYYTRNSYTLTFVTNGGSNVSSTTLKYQESIPSTTITSRSGYTFDGWYYDIQQMNPFEGMPAQDASAYAYYSEETRANYFDFTYSGGEAKITRGKQLSGAVVVPIYINDKLVTEIGEGAFEDCDAITSIDLPEYVDTLGASAFRGCTALERITGTENLAVIEDSTFEGCRSLSVFPDLSNVVSIGNNAFKDCVSLTTITISDTLTSIGNYAFSGCVSLLQTPDLTNVVSIGDYAFEGCRLLTEIKGLDGCATLGEGIFTACENIAKLTLVFKDTVEQYYIAKFFCGSDALGDEKYYQVEIDNALYYIPKALQEVEYTGTESIPEYFLYELSSIRTFKDKSNVTSEIGAHAFDGCSALETFTMSHPSVSSIGAYAFNGCSSIASLPNMSPETIGNYALSGCVSLLQTPDLTNVVSIGDYAFEGVNVFTNLTLPDSLLSLGEGAFSGCSSITTLSLPFTASSRTDLGDFGYIFGNKNYSGSYLATQNAGSYYIPGGLTTLTIRNGVIGEESIANVSSLANVTIGNNVTSIGPSALKGCSSIVNLSVPFVGAGEYSAIDRPINYSVSNSGSYGWELVDGIYRSTNYHVSSSTATMIVTFENSGTFTFKYRVSSQSSYDKLTITHNSTTLVNGISGNGSYIERTITVAKNDKLTLSYYKNASTNSNDDRSYFQVVSSHTTDPMPETLGHIFGTESYSGSYVAENYYIPSTLTNVSITAQEEIPAAAFKNCTSLTTVNIPSTTTSIGESAFYHCTSLVSLNGTNVINIPNSVVTIGNYAFFENTSATSLSIGSSVTSIGTYAFASNSSLMSVAVADESSLTTINNYAFSNCSSLTQFNFNGTSSLQTIGEGAFLSNTSLNKWGTNSSNTINIPAGVTSVGQQAFANETGITAVVIPASVATVGEGSFRGCNALVDLTMPKVYGNKLGHIFGTESYSGSYVAENYYIPSTLTNVSITAQEEIPAAAFKNCTSLTTVNIPSTTTSIGESAFYHCTSLVSLNGTNVINIPNSVTRIENNTFALDTSITAVNMGNNVTYLGESAFEGTTALANIQLSSSLETIDNRAFIGDVTLTTITIPESVLDIGNYAFNGCSNLTTVTCEGTSSITLIGNNVFEDCSSLLEVPNLPNVQSIGDGAFANCALLTDLSGLANLVSIGNYAFDGCSSLADITDLTVLQSIGNYAFRNCSSLVDVELPTSLETIGSYAFAQCIGLTNVHSFANVTSIGEYAFYNDSALQTLPASSAIETIGAYAFYNCSSLLVIPSYTTLNSIGNYAFANNNLITTIGSLSSLTSIGNHAFYNCASLLAVDFSADCIIGEAAFAKCASLENASVAFDSTHDFYYYFGSTESFEGSLTRTNGSSNMYYVPAGLVSFELKSLNGSIAASALYNCSQFTTLLLDETITSIGASAFYNCSGLTSLNIPDEVTSVGASILYGCSSLTDLKVPFVGTTPTSGADFGVIFGTSSYSNSYSAVQRTGTYYIPSSLVKLTISRNTINSNACANLSSITDLVVADSVTSIGLGAFKGCDALINVTLPFVGNTISSTYYNAVFGYIFGYTTVNGGSSSSSSSTVYYNAMYGTKPSGTTWQYTCRDYRYSSSSYYYNSYFYYIPQTIRNVTITKQTVFGTAAFNNCDFITSITNNSGMTMINSYAFQNCSNLKSFNGDNVINLPETIAEIGTYAFANCSAITTLSVGESTSTIGAYAFQNCSSLTSVTLAEGLVTIGSYAFANCILLAKINSNVVGEANFPDSLKSVGQNAFLNCDLLNNIVFGSSISSLQSNAFKGCANINRLTLSVNGDGWSSGVSLSSVFPDSIANITEIIVSDGEYLPDNIFKDMTNVEKIILPEGLISVGTSSFSGCTSLSKINSNTVGEAILPDTITSIGDSAFQGCTGFTYINLGESLSTTGTNSFEGCTGLVRIDIPETVTSIGKCSFKNCSNVQYFNSSVAGVLNVPSSCTTLVEYCFEGMDKITTVNIGDKVTSIGVGILLGANHVENITLPFIGSSMKADNSSYLSKFGMIFGYTTTNTSTTEVSGAIYSGLTISSKKYWFYVPNSLENVTVTVQTQVPSYAFYNCDMLSSIVMPQSVTTIGSEAFTNCSATVQYTYSPTISSPWDGSTVATSFHSGNGTEGNPYVIFDGNELAYLASQVNSGVTYSNTYFTLTCDIDLNDYAFVTIGDDTHPFLGNINGHGHSIQNYTITGSSTYVGFFGYFGGSLEHIGFFNGTITSTVSGNANYYAGLIAYMTETGSISNVYTNSKVFISGAYYIYAGGLVGYMNGGSITNSWASRDVSATNANLFAYAGGIAGYINAGTISGCYSSGAITANGSALSYSKNGQIIGEKSDNAVISNCYKYSGATLTRYGTTDSVYNEDGTSGTAAECISALRTIWDNSKWILNDGNWPKLRVL